MNAKRMRIGMEPIGTNYFQSAASSPSHQNNSSAMDLNGSGASFMNSPSKLENGFSSTPQKMSMSPVYAPADITRTNNNSSPAFEFNGQAAASSSSSVGAGAAGPTKNFPNYFNNHISNGKLTIFSSFCYKLFGHFSAEFADILSSVHFSANRSLDENQQTHD